MSVDVVYQGLTIARGAATKKVTTRELFIETDGPMPVATALTVSHGGHSVTAQVSRVVEGVGAGMVIVPTAGDLPGWVTHLQQPQVETVVIEAELEDDAPQKSAPPASSAPAAAPEPVVQAAPPAPAPVIEMTADLPPSAVTPDSPAESTVEFAIPTEEGGESADKKANRGKKKSSTRRR